LVSRRAGRNISCSPEVLRIIIIARTATADVTPRKKKKPIYLIRAVVVNSIFRAHGFKRIVVDTTDANRRRSFVPYGVVLAFPLPKSFTKNDAA